MASLRYIQNTIILFAVVCFAEEARELNHPIHVMDTAHFDSAVTIDHTPSISHPDSLLSFDPTTKQVKATQHPVSGVDTPFVPFVADNNVFNKSVVRNYTNGDSGYLVFDGIDLAGLRSSNDSTNLYIGNFYSATAARGAYLTLGGKTAPVGAGVVTLNTSDDGAMSIFAGGGCYLYSYGVLYLYTLDDDLQLVINGAIDIQAADSVIVPLLTFPITSAYENVIVHEDGILKRCNVEDSVRSNIHDSLDVLRSELTDTAATKSALLHDTAHEAGGSDELFDQNGNTTDDVTYNSVTATTTVTANDAAVPDASDGATVGTATLEWSDFYLADGGKIYFGDDQEVELEHIHNVGLSLNGYLGIGTSSPLARLDVSDGGSTMFLGADPGDITRTDNTNKAARIGMPQYDIDEEGSCFFYGYNSATANRLHIGGGTSSLNTATEVKIYTAANNATPTGTERVRIDSDGNVTCYEYVQSIQADEMYRVLYNNPSGYFDTSGIEYNPYTKQTTLPGNLYRDSTGNFIIGIQTSSGYDDKTIVINPAGAQDVSRSPYLSITANDDLVEPNTVIFRTNSLSTVEIDSGDLVVGGDARFYLHPSTGNRISIAAGGEYINKITASSELQSELHLIAGQGYGVEVKAHRFDINDTLYLIGNNLIDEDRYLSVNSSDQVVSAAYKDTVLITTSGYLIGDSAKTGIVKRNSETGDGECNLGWLGGSDYGPQIRMYEEGHSGIGVNEGRVAITRQSSDSIALRPQGISMAGNVLSGLRIAVNDSDAIPLMQLEDSLNLKADTSFGQAACSIFDGATFRATATAYWHQAGKTFTIDIPELSGVITASTVTYLRVATGTMPSPPIIGLIWTKWIGDAAGGSEIICLKYGGTTNFKICKDPLEDYLTAGTITFFATSVSWVVN